MTTGLRLTLTPTSDIDPSDTVLVEMATKLAAQLDEEAFHTFVAGNLFCVTWKQTPDEPSPGAGDYFCTPVPLIIPVNSRRVFMPPETDELLISERDAVDPEGGDSESGLVYLLYRMQAVDTKRDSLAPAKLAVTHNCRQRAVGGATEKSVAGPGKFISGPMGTACPTALTATYGRPGLVAINWDWAKTYPSDADEPESRSAHHDLQLLFGKQSPVLLVAMSLTDSKIAWYPIQTSLDYSLLENVLRKDNGKRVFKSTPVTFLDGPDILLGRFDYRAMEIA